MTTQAKSRPLKGPYQDLPLPVRDRYRLLSLWHELPPTLPPLGSNGVNMGASINLLLTKIAAEPRLRIAAP